MKKFRFALLALTLLSTNLICPVLADTDKTMDMAKGTALFPVKVAAVSSGIFFGTPIAITRYTATKIREYTGNAADKIGGKEHFSPNLFACLFSIPAGTLVGVSEGCYYGTKNAIVNGVDKPFSLESFTLGSLE